MGIFYGIPSGKHTKNYGESPFLIGTSSINGSFSIAMLNYQRVYIHIYVCYCRASHTGDAIRVMYSSVSVGVVHVLCACAQVQSTVYFFSYLSLYPSYHTSFRRIFVLVLLVLVLALVLVLVLVVVVIITPVAFFLNLAVAENRQIGGVFTFFETLGANNHRKYRCFLRLGSQKPQYLYAMFFASGSKHHGTDSVFVPVPSKQLVFTQFSPC